MNILRQSLVLFSSFLIIFLWEVTPLINFTVPILGFLAFLFLIIMIKKKGLHPAAMMGDSANWSVFLLNTLVFLLILATGGINSSLFFLIYFVGFGIAFVFEPVVVFVFLLGTTAVLLPLILQDDVFGNAVKSGSLLIVGPLAYFFGREYRKEEEEDAALHSLEDEAHKKATAIEKSVVDVLDQEKDVLDKETLKKLKGVLKNSNELREETKE